MTSSRRREIAADMAVVAAAWAGFLALIAILHVLRQGTGFAVWPLGEDRNWIDMLQRGDAVGTARMFWAIDGRNPLSAWWYISLGPLILGLEPGLLLIRYTMGLALALCAYALMRTLLGRAGRPWQLGIAIAIALSMANAYFDNIFWNLQGALIVSIACIIAYLRYVQGGRTSAALYGCSLVLWFLAFASYSIQCGAIAAIFYLALRHPPCRPNIAARLAAIALELAPFAVLFVLFVLVWQTSTLGSGFGLAPQADALLTSLREGIWHSDLGLLTAVLKAMPGHTAFAGASALLAAGIALALWLRRPRELAARPAARPLVDLLVVALCIALPTIAVEASNPAWGPGSRWRMIYQFTSPVFHLGLVALVLAAAPMAPRLRGALWIAVVAIYGGAMTTLSLAHNAKQVEWTASEKAVFHKIRGILLENNLAGGPRQLNFVIRAGEGLHWRSSATLNQTYMRSWFGPGDMTLTIVHPLTNQALMGPGDWPIFQDDGIVLSPGPGRPATTLPYERTHILFGQDDRLTEPGEVRAADFNGFAARWQRSAPLPRQTGTIAATCPSIWHADRPIMARGLSPVAENGPDGAFRWSTSKSVRLTLANLCDGARKLRIVVAGAIDTRNLEALTARADGTPVALARVSERSGEIVYEGVLPEGATARREMHISLNAPVIMTPGNGDPRRLGIAIKQIGFDR